MQNIKLSASFSLRMYHQMAQVKVKLSHLPSTYFKESDGGEHSENKKT